jgi:8-oxo-dGTP pyrophosphatase MutT (NUDIX family)
MVKEGETVLAIIYRYQNGVLQVVMQGSESLIPKYQYQGRLDKFPGGRVEASDTNLRSACAREAEEEVWLRLKDGVELSPVYEYIDRRERKIFIPIHIDDLEGEMRTVVITDNSSKLLPPYWVDFTPDVIETKLYRTHKPGGWEFYSKFKK